MLGGKFEIRDVPPGTYDLIVMLSERVQGAATQAERFPVYVGRTPVEVGSGDVSGIRVTVSRGREVRGTVSFAAGSAAPERNAMGVALRSAAPLPGVFDEYR